MTTIMVIAALMFAVVIHEYAHGWVAFKRGDQTAKMMGRLTLNPLKHIDPIGTLLVPFVLHLLNLTPIGWAKPVPVNFQGLRNPRMDMILVAAAGPGVNFLAAIFFSLLIRSQAFFGLLAQIGIGEVCFVFFIFLIHLNLMLGLFNLIPIPPLDGSRILMGLLPDTLAAGYRKLEPYGFLFLIVLLNLGFLDFIDKVVMRIFSAMGMNFT